MYNDHLSQEEARLIIEEHRKEAETYSRQKQLGFGDSRSARWTFLLIVVIALVVVAVLL